MKKLIALLAAVASTGAFGHDSTVPHVHPHGVSLLPDWGVLALTALLVGGVFLFIQNRHRIK